MDKPASRLAGVSWDAKQPSVCARSASETSVRSMSQMCLWTYPSVGNVQAHVAPAPITSEQVEDHHVLIPPHLYRVILSLLSPSPFLYLHVRNWGTGRLREKFSEVLQTVLLSEDVPECNTAFYCDDVFLSALRGCVWSVVLQALLLPWKGLSEGSWKEAQAMWLQIYSALSLDSPTGNWDICFFPGSSIGYVVFCFFFFSLLFVPESNFSGRVILV